MSGGQLALPTERRLHLGAALLTALVLMWAAQPGRGVIGGLALLLFLATVPGWVLTSFRPVRSGPYGRAALAVALSLALGTLAVTVALWLRWWQPMMLLHVIGVLCFVGSAAALMQRDEA